MLTAKEAVEMVTISYSKAVDEMFQKFDEAIKAEAKNGHFTCYICQEIPCILYEHEEVVVKLIKDELTKLGYKLGLVFIDAKKRRVQATIGWSP